VHRRVLGRLSSTIPAHDQVPIDQYLLKLFPEGISMKKIRLITSVTGLFLLGGCWLFRRPPPPPLPPPPVPPALVIGITPAAGRTITVYVVRRDRYSSVSACATEANCPQLSNFRTVTLFGQAQTVTVGSGDDYYLFVVCGGRIVEKRLISPYAGGQNSYHVSCQ